MKKIFTLISLLLVTLQLSAGPIGEIRARQIAEEFFTEYATTRSAASIELEWAGDAITELRLCPMPRKVCPLLRFSSPIMSLT